MGMGELSVLKCPDTRWCSGLEQAPLPETLFGAHSRPILGFGRTVHVCQPPLKRHQGLKELCAFGSGRREVLSCLQLCQLAPTPVPLLLHSLSLRASLPRNYRKSKANYQN